MFCYWYSLKVKPNNTQYCFTQYTQVFPFTSYLIKLYFWMSLQYQCTVAKSFIKHTRWSDINFRLVVWPLWATNCGSLLIWIEGYDVKSGLDYILHFLFQLCSRNLSFQSQTIMLRSKIQHVKKVISLSCHVLGLLIAVEVYEICGPQRMYWASNVSNLFPGMDFSKIMSGSWFETIPKYLNHLMLKIKTNKF